MVQDSSEIETLRPTLEPRTITDTGLVFNEDKAVYQYVTQFLQGVELSEPIMAVGSLLPGRVDRIIGGVVYYEYRPQRMVSMACAGVPGWLNRKKLRDFFSIAFDTLEVRRVNSVVPANYQIAIKFNNRLGFVMEGQVRQSMPDGSDALIFGMIKEECKWINGTI